MLKHSDWHISNPCFTSYPGGVVSPAAFSNWNYHFSAAFLQHSSYEKHSLQVAKESNFFHHFCVLQCPDSKKAFAFSWNGNDRRTTEKMITETQTKQVHGCCYHPFGKHGGCTDLIWAGVQAVIQALPQAHIKTQPGFPLTLRQIQSSGISIHTEVTILPHCFSVHYAGNCVQGC